MEGALIGRGGFGEMEEDVAMDFLYVGLTAYYPC